MKYVVLGAVAVLAVIVANAKAEENLTYQTQVARGSDALQNLRLAQTRAMDSDRSLRTLDYYRCMEDDGYGRQRPCSASDNGAGGADAGSGSSSK